MGALRKQMDGDLVVRGMAVRTREAYLGAVAQLAKYYRRSPDRISEQEVQRYLLYLIQEKKLAWSSCNVAAQGLRFFASAIAPDDVRQIMQNHPGLREAQAAVIENRDLPHLVGVFPPLRGACLAFEKIDIDRSPPQARHFHQQGGLVRVAGLGEAVKHEVGHGEILPVRSQSERER